MLDLLDQRKTRYFLQSFDGLERSWMGLFRVKKRI